MLNNIIALCFLVAGVGSIAFSKQLGWEANPAFLLKFGGSAIFGAGYFIYFYGLSILNMIKLTPKQPSKIFTPENYEIKDFEAITHLRDRCVQASSAEGVDICSKLAAVMFQLDTPKV